MWAEVGKGPRRIRIRKILIYGIQLCIPWGNRGALFSIRCSYTAHFFYIIFHRIDYYALLEIWTPATFVQYEPIHYIHIIHELIQLHICRYTVVCMAACIETCCTCKYTCKLTYMCMYGCIHGSIQNSYYCKYVGIHLHVCWHIMRPVWVCKYPCSLTYMCMYGCIHGVILLHVFCMHWYVWWHTFNWLALQSKFLLY